MENFKNLVIDVWNSGFFGIDLGSIILSLIVILIAFLFRSFIISVILNSFIKLADKTDSKIDDEILNALKKPIGLVPITIALYVCTLILPLSGVIGDIATNEYEGVRNIVRKFFNVPDTHEIIFFQNSLLVVFHVLSNTIGLEQSYILRKTHIGFS